MSNPFAGDVAFGPDHTMRIGALSLSLMQIEFGESIATIGTNLVNGTVDLNIIGFLVWSGLQHHHPAMTLRDVFALLDVVGLEDAAAAIATAFERSTVASTEGKVTVNSKPKRVTKTA
jgi:hypothetical protein